MALVAHLGLIGLASASHSVERQTTLRQSNICGLCLETCFQQYSDCGIASGDSCEKSRMDSVSRINKIYKRLVKTVQALCKHLPNIRRTCVEDVSTVEDILGMS